ncbi:hypothetical protein FCM35_KLT06542 [Carex littledalei]|uniref:RNase H type-1 domain-containing protein n=1 Tax=Carex littledalei TaxID=544730 RepID=A0A833R0W9_9POAL|nr:hypothetical protein FCM35_KLT06542 [Carex littledalei]
MPKLVSPIMPKRERLEAVLVPRGKMVILMDASWDSTRRTGTSFVFFDGQGRLQYVQMNHTTCSDPLQAEAMALLQVLRYVERELSTQILTQVLLCSECKILVNAILQNNFLELPSWQAAEMVVEGAQLYHTMIERVTLRHVNRELVTQPHFLANWARTSGSNCEGMLHLVKAEKARAFIPKEFRLVEAFGYTLGGFFLAHYEDSPAGKFDELVVIAGIVWNPPTSCAWAARVLVNSDKACHHGRKEIGLPSHTATFSKKIVAATEKPSNKSQSFLNSIAMNSTFGNQMELGEIEVSEAKNPSEMPLCNISLPFSVLKSENSDKGMPKIRMSLPSFSGRTEDYPHLLKYSCDIECRVSAVKPAKVYSSIVEKEPQKSSGNRAYVNSDQLSEEEAQTRSISRIRSNGEGPSSPSLDQGLVPLLERKLDPPQPHHLLRFDLFQNRYYSVHAQVDDILKRNLNLFLISNRNCGTTLLFPLLKSQLIKSITIAIAEATRGIPLVKFKPWSY